MKKYLIYLVVVFIGLFLFLSVQKAWSEELKTEELANWEVAEILQMTDVYGVFVLGNENKDRFAVALIRRDGMIMSFVYLDNGKVRKAVLQEGGYVEVSVPEEHAKMFLDVLLRFEKKVRS